MDFCKCLKPELYKDEASGDAACNRCHKWAVEDRLKHLIAQQDIGRNDPCYCGSGQKFKKCCGAWTPPPPKPVSHLETT